MTTYWEYKVAYNYPPGLNYQTWLSSMGREGWELTHVAQNLWLFKRAIERAAEPLPIKREPPKTHRIKQSVTVKAVTEKDFQVIEHAMIADGWKHRERYDSFSDAWRSGIVFEKVEDFVESESVERMSVAIGQLSDYDELRRAVLANGWIADGQPVARVVLPSQLPLDVPGNYTVDARGFWFQEWVCPFKRRKL